MKDSGARDGDRHHAGCERAKRLAEGRPRREQETSMTFQLVDSTQGDKMTTKTTNSSVSWASSEPFDVPAYATAGEWGDFVADMKGPRLTSNRDEALVLTPEQQRRLAHRVKRFYKADEYRQIMDAVNTARGWF